MVYQSEKTLDEMGDKLEADDKQTIESAIEKVKTALSGTDTQVIKDAVAELEKAFYAASEKLYSQAPPQDGAPGPDFSGRADFTGAGPGGQDDGVYDADYEVVDDE
jgi:molecular chaperone DnaK